MQHDHIKKRFHESEKRFWTFFDSSPTGLVIVGLSHKIEHANGAFQDLVGYSVHDLRARTIEDLLHRKEIPIWSPLLQELARGERDVVRLEQKFIHADNLPRWATSAYVVMRDPDGSPAYFLGMVADRTADAAAVDAVIVCDPLTDLYNPNVIRSGVGGIFTVQTAVCSSEEALQWLKANQITSYAAELQAAEFYQNIDFRTPSALVMGTEADGLTDFWLHNADHRIKIPMLGEIDSLNVSVSTAVLAFEARRQRLVVEG